MSRINRKNGALLAAGLVALTGAAAVANEVGITVGAGATVTCGAGNHSSSECDVGVPLISAEIQVDTPTGTVRHTGYARIVPGNADRPVPFMNVVYELDAGSNNLNQTGFFKSILVEFDRDLDMGVLYQAIAAGMVNQKFVLQPNPMTKMTIMLGAGAGYSISALRDTNGDNQLTFQTLFGAPGTALARAEMDVETHGVFLNARTRAFVGAGIVTPSVHQETAGVNAHVEVGYKFESVGIAASLAYDFNYRQQWGTVPMPATGGLGSPSNESFGIQEHLLMFLLTFRF